MAAAGRDAKLIIAKSSIAMHFQLRLAFLRPIAVPPKPKTRQPRNFSRESRFRDV
jgi:hypothetical protein